MLPLDLRERHNRTVEFQASPDGGKTWPADALGPELVQLFTGLTVVCCGRSATG